MQIRTTCYKHTYNKHTFASRFAIRPFLGLDHVSRSSNEVLVLICGVQGDIIRVPGLRQSNLCTLLSNFLNLEKHSTLEQVDVLKEPQRQFHSANTFNASKFELFNAIQISDSVVSTQWWTTASAVIFALIEINLNFNILLLILIINNYLVFLSSFAIHISKH